MCIRDSELALGVSGAYLLGLESSPNFTPHETTDALNEFAKKYNELDDEGKQVLETFLNFAITSKSKQKTVIKFPKRAPTNKGLDNLDDNTINFPNMTPVKISEQSSAAGLGVYLGPESFTEFLVQDNELIRRTAFAVPVSGDSMEPKFHDGDIALVNFEPAEPGELGRIVITDLFNYAFPILRYDNGDTAVATRKEKNGRYKLYLDELYGRRSDLIYDCEGKAVTPYIITNNLWDIEGVKQYRFIQEDVKDYTIWLNGDPQKMNQEEILGRIRPYLGEEARIKVELVDEIPVLASGKRKYIENRCEKYKNQTGFCG